MTVSAPPALLVVEADIWIPGAEWRAALDHVATRLARVATLDVDAILAAGDIADQVAALDAWAAPLDVDLDRELGRWFDENLAMHVRPDSKRTRAVRALAAERAVHAASALPARAAESLLRHAGVWRSIAELHAPISDLDALATALGASRM